VAGAPARPGGKWWTLVAVCLGMFMLLLDITIVTVALPDIQRGLGSSFSGLQWIVDAYALTLAAFLLTAGSLSDMYGRRRLFLIGLVVFTGAWAHALVRHHGTRAARAFGRAVAQQVGSFVGSCVVEVYSKNSIYQSGRPDLNRRPLDPQSRSGRRWAWLGVAQWAVDQA